MLYGVSIWKYRKDDTMKNRRHEKGLLLGGDRVRLHQGRTFNDEDGGKTVIMAQRKLRACVGDPVRLVGHDGK